MLLKGPSTIPLLCRRPHPHIILQTFSKSIPRVDILMPYLVNFNLFRRVLKSESDGNVVRFIPASIDHGNTDTPPGWSIAGLAQDSTDVEHLWLAPNRSDPGWKRFTIVPVSVYNLGINRDSFFASHEVGE